MFHNSRKTIDKKYNFMVRGMVSHHKMWNCVKGS